MTELNQALGRVSEKGQVRRGGETEREEALWRLRNSRSEESRSRVSPRATSRRGSATLLACRARSLVPWEVQAASLELASVHSVLNLQVTHDLVHDVNSSTVMTMEKRKLLRLAMAQVYLPSGEW